MPEKYRRPHHHERVRTAERMKRAWEAEADARDAVLAFNTRIEQGRTIWAWPTVAAALTGRHPWVTIICDSCDGVTDLDLRMKPRPPETPIAAVLTEAKCPRCNGHGRPRIFRLRSHPGLNCAPE